MPCRRSTSIASRLVSRGRSATAMMPTARRRARRAPACARGAHRRRARAWIAGEHSRAPRTAGGCRERRCAPSTRPRRRGRQRATTTSAASATEHGARRGVAGAIACAIGCSDRCSTDAASATTAPRRRRSSGTTSDHLGHAARQRAGLVERDAAHRGRALEVRAALDQHALPRRAGQRRDDRHRRRDDERAGTRDDQQHERAVDPRSARRRRTRAAGATASATARADHRRRVDAREALDERLRRRPLRLRLLDQVNDPRERRVAAEPRHAHLERAAAVDGAGEHLVAGRLVDRQRLAGHRRLVDGARARHDLAVERNLLARLDDDDAPGSRASRRRRAARLPRRGPAPRRRQIHQRADRESRALERPRFERLRDGEQEDDRRGLGPLAERDRAGRGDEHQDVDVERAQRGRRARPSARRVRHASGDRDAQTSTGAAVARASTRSAASPAAEQQRRQPTRSSAAAALSGLAGGDRLLVLEPGAHARVGDGGGNGRGRQLGRVVLHVQPLAHQVGGEVLEAAAGA